MNNTKKTSTSNVAEELTFSTIASYLVPFAIIAAVIAWYKNSDVNIIVRLSYVFIAYLLNIVYILYSMYRLMFPSKNIDFASQQQQ